jgi:hypothetical protein
MSDEVDLLGALIEHEYRHLGQQLALQQQQLLELHELRLQHERQYAVQEELGKAEAEEDAEEEAAMAAMAAAVVASLSASSSSSSSLSSEVYEGEEPSRRLEHDQERGLLQDGEQHECAHAHAYAKQQQPLLQHLREQQQHHQHDHHETYPEQQQLQHLLEQQQHHQHDHHEAYPKQDEALGANAASPKLTGREKADSVGSIDVELCEEDEQSGSSEGDGEEMQVDLLSPVKAEPSTDSVFAGRPPCETARGGGKPKCRRRWSSEEDARLAQIVATGAHLLVETGKTSWKALATHFEGRYAQQCKQRYEAIKRGLKTGKWTADEDRLLKEAVALHGPKWAKVSRLVPGRTAKGCRDRYLSCVNPAIKLSEWTPEEEQTCVTAYRAYGNRWVAIQKLLPNRPWYTIKWKVGMLKKQGRIVD